MSKITRQQGRAIYEQVTDPANRLSNREIGEKYGITERSVRFRVNTLEKQVHEIARSDTRVNNALVAHTLNVQSEALTIIAEVRNSLTDAKAQGISPERLGGLYGAWIKSLELASEILGDIDRTPVMNVQINNEYQELKSFVIGALCPACKASMILKLKAKA